MHRREARQVGWEAQTKHNTKGPGQDESQAACTSPRSEMNHNVTVCIREDRERKREKEREKRGLTRTADRIASLQSGSAPIGIADSMNRRGNMASDLFSKCQSVIRRSSESGCNITDSNESTAQANVKPTRLRFISRHTAVVEHWTPHAQHSMLE